MHIHSTIKKHEQMAAIITRDISLAFSSRPEDGAQNRSEDGSTFSVTLPDPLKITTAAVTISAGLSSASIWWTSPNISAPRMNNLFHFTTSHPSAPGSYVFTIPTGLYTLQNLDGAIGLQMQDAGLPDDLFRLSADNATGSVILTIKLLGDVARVGATGSVCSMLGWPKNHPDLIAPEADDWEYSPEQAGLNVISRFTVVCSLFQGGILLNGQQRGIVGVIPISVAPGSLISYEPPHVQLFACNDLRGQVISNITISLRDQSGRPVDTGGEFFDISITIKVNILLSSTGPLPMQISD